jgi:hypothetical protein
VGSALIDTADFYGPYLDEELVSRAIVGSRDEEVLARKVGLSCPDNGRAGFEKAGTSSEMVSPATIRKGCDESLRRLGVDVIGLSEVDVETLRRTQSVRPIAAVQSSSTTRRWKRSTNCLRRKGSGQPEW